MKKLLIIFSFITCIIMTACSEEDSPLLFSVESVSNPENVIFIENHEGKISEEYICSGGFWKAEIVNSNTITFTFAVIDSDSYLDQAGFNVVSQTNKGMVRTGIYVKRLPTTSPVEF